MGEGGWQTDGQLRLKDKKERNKLFEVTLVGSRDGDEADKNVSTIGETKFGADTRDPLMNPPDSDDPLPIPKASIAFETFHT